MCKSLGYGGASLIELAGKHRQSCGVTTGHKKPRTYFYEIQKKYLRQTVLFFVVVVLKKKMYLLDKIELAHLF